MARAFSVGIFTVSESFATVMSSACGTGGSLDAVDHEFLISSPTSITVPNGGRPVIDTARMRAPVTDAAASSRFMRMPACSFDLRYATSTFQLK